MLRKLRGVAGLGLIGGVLGFLGGALWGGVSVLVDIGVFGDVGYWSLVLRRVVEDGSFWAKPTAFATAGFGVALGALGKRLSLRDLSALKMGLVGAVVGALFIPAYVLVVVGPASLLGFTAAVLPDLVLFSAVGGMLTASFTAAAKNQLRRELEVVREVAALADAGAPASGRPLRRGLVQRRGSSGS
jgi:hypothetical protein